MNSRNLISYYQGEEAIYGIDQNFKKDLQYHEIKTLHSFCDEMFKAGCNISDFNGFFIGYKIQQIGKEFDLLRFGKDSIINIELKSFSTEEKMKNQLIKNYYYLKFLGCKLDLFTYVENDSYYEYDGQNFFKVDAMTVSKCLKEQVVDYSKSPDEIFVPSTYLVSPFNSVDKFMENEYFLTSAQQNIKDEFYSKLCNKEFVYFTISANAGTGKTLLTYDISKDLIAEGHHILIIHCGFLNEGQLELKHKYKWNIVSISTIRSSTVKALLHGISTIIIDEAQRIDDDQLSLVLTESKKNNIPIIFSYDEKQSLKEKEGKNIEKYIKNFHPEIKLISRKLTTKIRTNKEIASFINNLLEIGHSKDHLDYKCISIEYFEDMDNLTEYMKSLDNNGWETITYTTSKYSPDPYDSLTKLSKKNAHVVIGQEFKKVAFIMDRNFRYDNNKLKTRKGYYSSKGMLYQIVTRAVDELKIIVFKNPQLYIKLLGIKDLSNL